MYLGPERVEWEGEGEALLSLSLSLGSAGVVGRDLQRGGEGRGGGEERR